MFIYNDIFKLRIAIVILLGITMMPLSCSKDYDQPRAEVPGKYPSQEGWNSKLTATKDGMTAAIIKYGHMRRYDEEQTVYFDEGVEVDFYNNEGVHTSKLTSDKGRLEEQTSNVEALENVVVVSDSGITLRTEKLWWDNAAEKVKSDQFVTITTADKDTLYGIGFESDQTLSNWILMEPRGKTDKKINLNFDRAKQKASEPDTSGRKPTS